MSVRVDLAIIGGGCAGLSLASRLAVMAPDLSFAIIEPRDRYVEDRTWCLWIEDGGDYDGLVYHVWPSWSVSESEEEHIHHGSRWQYAMIRSSDFYKYSLATIGRTKQAKLMLGQSVRAVRHGSELITLDTDASVIEARYVVDTRPPSQEQRLSAPFAQVFLGMEIETDSASFDPRVAGLMRSMRGDRSGLAFDYVLPLSPHRALIERTRFATKSTALWAANKVIAERGVLLEQFGLADARILRHETGWLPMGLPVTHDVQGNIVRAGISGGALRASTGYAFRRIQAWAAKCAAALTEGKPPVGQSKNSAFLSFMDASFLAALSRNPASSASIFMKVAKALDGDGFARFMSDSASMRDWTKVATALPKRPFLAAALGTFAHGPARSVSTS